MRDETCVWTGASGRRYVFYVYDDTPDPGPRAGLYVYAKRAEDGSWSPVYIGEGDLGSRCREDAALMACIEGKGATQIHLRINPDEASRRSERRDLLQALRAAYAPTGCHRPDQPFCVWSGESGQDLTFYVYDKDEPMPSRPGLFIYARRGPREEWIPLYVGQGDIGSRTDGRGDLDGCLADRGCTHVHIRIEPDEAARIELRQDLLAKHGGVFAPLGCQPDTERIETVTAGS